MAGFPRSRDRVVVEVALDNRLEPFAGLRHRIMHVLVELRFDFPQLRSHALRIVLRFTVKLPSRSCSAHHSKKASGFPEAFFVLEELP